MFVKPFEKLLNKLSTSEKDFLLYFVAKNKECSEKFYNDNPNIQKSNHLNNDDNRILQDLTTKDITKLKKAIKKLDLTTLNYYSLNFKLFTNSQNTNSYIKITTREEEDIFIYL